MKSLPTLSQEGLIGDEHLYVEVRETRAYYLENRGGVSQGQFNMHLSITALQGDVYVPMSLASGKKSTGFVYHIEGTGEGNISTASVTCSGEEVTQVTLGTLQYAKIPQGKSALFEMVITIEGAWGNVYRVIINRINYKLTPSDARYKKFSTTISSSELTFR